MTTLTASKFREMAEEAHKTAKSKEWWELDSEGNAKFSSRNFEELLFLAITELAEAFEVFRDNVKLDAVWNDEKTGKPEGFPVELGDFVIRLGDTIMAGGAIDGVCQILKSYEDKTDMQGETGVGVNLGSDLLGVTGTVCMLDRADIPFDEDAHEQFANAIALCFEVADVRKIDLWSAITMKLGYNKSRAPRHGGKAA